MEREKYFLGLDIGTDSVGYAATDEEYNLRKFRGEPVWGVTLFEEAKRRDERRAFRTGRRRIDRRQQRVALVRELFAMEIAKIDPRFFIRQEESALFRDEAEEPYSLFNDEQFTDREYGKKYPTIHHLLTELMYSAEPHDVRLVCLACTWLVAHRGHFLNEMDRENVGSVTDSRSVFEAFSAFFADREYAVPWREEDLTIIADVLRKSRASGQKVKEIAEKCFKGKIPKAGSEEFPFSCDVLVRALCGNRINAQALFEKPEYEEIKFSLGDDEETLAEAMGQLGDDAELISVMKAVYDWALLVNVLNGAPTISEAKVEVYNRHKADLAALKSFIRRYCPEQYRPLFRNAEENWYSVYVGHVNSGPVPKRATKENFYKKLSSILKKITPEEADKAFYDDMQDRISLGTFLPKQRDPDNRVIPHQLYWYELDLILKNAEKYLPFLCEAEDGLTVSDKLRSIFTFHIPYYVGPLNSASSFAWVKWIGEKAGRVLPWKFEEMVDLDGSEQEFIKRMTNTCTYLPGEKVLPKDSMAYHRFEVLNEINNLKINEVPITVEQKQALYRELFEGRRQVTRKRIEDWLIASNIMQRGDRLSGIDEQIKSNLKPQHDFKRLLGAEILSEQDAEEIIERATYSQDRKRFVRWLERHYPHLSESDITYLSRLNYKDFGRLSRRFLNGIEGANKETGEIFTILSALWNTNCNMSELLSDRYTFAEVIKEELDAYYKANPQTLDERLDSMYVSNAVKRPVIRTLEIVKEVAKALGGAPERIFVEMARGASEDQKGKRTKTRKEQLTELYEKCRDEDVRAFQKQLEEMGADADNRLQSDRLYLYYLQLGRCLYTGKPLDPTRLSGDASIYNIDHIYPQCYVKDDSLLNNEVLVYSEENGRKTDTYPVDSAIQRERRGFWELLHKNGLMSDEKLRRLTRTTPFTEDERWGFIQRQLTETTQSTKAVATLLKEMFPDTEIVYVKARLVSEFRQAFDCLKSRVYNDLHHAKDAYLNIVAGNVYHMRFSKRWFVPRNQSYNVQAKKLFDQPVVCGGVTVWRGESDLGKVKRVLAKNNARLTRYAFCRRGGFFDQMPVKAAAGLIPRKKGLPTDRYGRYNKPTASFFALVRYRVGKKSDIMIMPVELLHADTFLNDDAYALEYAKGSISEILGKAVDEVSFPIGKRVLKVNAILLFDGCYKVCIAGKSSGGRCIIVSTQTQFSAGADTERYLKRLESFREKRVKNQNLVCDPKYDKITREENMALYDLYVEKLANTVYRKRVNSPLETLKSGKDRFEALSLEDQVDTLLNIHSIFGRLSGGCDLSKVGGTKRAAATVALSSSISNWKKNYTDVRIVDESASGLWNRKSQNLFDLL